MKKFCGAIKRLCDDNYFIILTISSLILNIIIECLGRRSIPDTFLYGARQPLMFLNNALIIFATLSICQFLKRRLFFLALFSVIWLICGITNNVLLGFRETPLAAADLQILGSALSIMHIYVKNLWTVLIAVAAAAISGLSFIWLKAPKHRGAIPYFKSFATVIAAVVLIVVISSASRATEDIHSNYPNIAVAYEEYGFAYCFLTGLIDQGIERPDDYSAEYMDELKQRINARGNGAAPGAVPGAGGLPNIIMVQLESFFDVNQLDGIKFSENPVPAFTRLKKDFSGGLLSVPSIGGGTANTEFEILTGLNLEIFGVSEYPYMTELTDKTVESLCYDLHKYGYSSHAIHNNGGEFFNRHKVFPNLGFDYFTPVEYMYPVELNACGWAEDSILLSEIADALDLTDSRDFIYAITVQLHGKYPDELPEGAPADIKVESVNDDITDGYINELVYYVNQLREVDRFIEALTNFCAGYDEPILAVFFSDHLPSLALEEFDLPDDELFQTEYIVWNNYDLPVGRKDIKAYDMSAHIFDVLGIKGGYVNTYNRFFAEDADYPAGLQYLGYDMLEGGGAADIKPADTQMGTKIIRVTGIYDGPADVAGGARGAGGGGADGSDGGAWDGGIAGGAWYAGSGENYGDVGEDTGSYNGVLGAGERPAVIVKGENFTPYSYIFLNDRKLDTIFVDNGTLLIDGVINLREGDDIAIAQIGAGYETLSKSEAIIYLR